jgi:serine/threonine protein kinase/tetratricopeptide (TPR) repeat protein
MAEKPRDIEAIYSTALKKGSGQERSEYLDEVCGDDHALRARIEALLKASEEVGDFLEPPILNSDVTLNNSPMTEVPGTVIGPYKLLEKIGEGGMAVVYMAEQHKPFHRRVALKIIKLGMDTKQVISRFEVERQALAMMDHPNIAKVFDAGATETGRPYFVMELVRGLTITEYCDKNKRNTQERLELLVPVCNAVQHAHQKGIIHRDIKPSNIMVTLHDGKPVPKIIDFGIAKATNQRLTERTVFTRYAEMIGTPEYMSPEQAEMSGLDIDTQTDIYSLGVVLYELLTGVLPFDADTLRSAALGEIQRIIREEEPPRPSMRLSVLGERAEKIAECRGTEISILVTRLRKELEWIPLKAMRKDRTRRYRSAAEMSDDVQNYLNGAPLIAGPESSMYRLKKSIRRNRTLMTGIAAVLVVLIAGIVVSTVLAISADRARAEAERQARISQAVVFFLTDVLLGYVAPENPEVTVHSVLDTASMSLEGRFEGKPLIEASIRERLGETYRKLGDYKAAEPHLERAYQIRAEQLGEKRTITFFSMGSLGRIYRRQGKLNQAEQLLAEGYHKSRESLGEEHPCTIQHRIDLGFVYYRQGRIDEAQALFPKAIEVTEMVRRVIGHDNSVALDAMYEVGVLYLIVGRDDEAETLLVKVLEGRRRVLGTEHPDTQASRGIVYFMRGQYDKAEPLLIKTLEMERRRKDQEMPPISMYLLTVLHHRQGDYDRAEPLLLEFLELNQGVLIEGHPDMVVAMKELINLYESWDKPEKAEQWRAKLHRKIGNE